MKKRLYLDLDGVMMDFDTYFLKLFGMKSKDLDDAILWKKIKDYGTFFEELPLFDGAKEFLETLENNFSVTILTACPKTDYRTAAIQKRNCVYKKLGTHIPVIPMLGGANKALFMHAPGDILIDDFQKNITAWNEHGGIGILHTNYDNTLEELFGVRPHRYFPDPMMMGDCAVCGNTRETHVRIPEK